MIDLKKYFIERYKDYKYYEFYFADLLINNEVKGMIVCDEVDAIEKFKSLIQPYNKSRTIIDAQNDLEFLYICFYLNDLGYYIEQFPGYLERPTNRYDFSYDKIRNKLLSLGGYHGVVAWADRRVFIENLEFKKIETNKIADDLAEILKKVSTRNAEFISMTYDEKLEAICNSIEYLLKPGKKSDKFLVLDYTDSEGYLSDDIVKGFRNKLECFRHSTPDDINKRSEYTDEQKKFLVSYGLVIIDYINTKLNNKN